MLETGHKNVTSVHWSSVTSGEACHLCVVHQQNVTVWRVSGDLPKLSFKLVRKINVRPVPQGCLWNPCNDVLCLLSRHQCSFYFRHDLNKGSYAFPALESGSIACGCWSTDGAKLIICVGTVLLIYRWPDINASLDAFAATAWRIPGLEGKLTSIVAVLKESIVVAAEVPLDSLCKQPDLFKIPDSQGDGQKNSDGVIRPLKSAMDSLMNLQHNSEAISETRSTLTMVHLSDRSRDPIKLSTIPLKGVLTPDILIYEKSSHCIIVGSNSQSQLHIYALLEKHLAYCGNIQLDKNQRPKGLCSIPTYSSDHEAALLILVGHRGMEESGFLSSSLESEFKLSLKYIMLKTGSRHHSRHSHHNDNIRGAPLVHTKSSSLVSPEPGVTGPHHLKTLSDPSVQSGRHEWQMAHSTSSDDPTPLALSTVKDSSLELETLVTKPSTDDTIPKKRLIEDLASDPPCEEQLQVDIVSFASHVPSFDNSKLANSYQLEPTDKFNTDQASPLQNSASEFLQGRKVLGDAAVNTQTLMSSSSVKEQLETEPRKHLKSSSSVKEQFQFEPEKQKLSSAVEKQFQTEPGKHLKSSLSIEEHLQTELGKYSNSWSEKAKSTDDCQGVRPEGGYGNTAVTNNHMQKSLSPSTNMLHNSRQISVLSTSTPVSSQTEKITLLDHLHSETKLQTTSVYSKASEEPPEDLSSSDMLLPKSLRSLQTDSVHTREDCSNSLTDSALQMSSISSQTDSVDTSEDFSSLLTDRIPQGTSISSQTEADSSDCFSSSSYSSIKASNISAFSQTEDLLTEMKSETKSIFSQTSPVYLSSVPSKILEAKDHSLQTESDTSDQFQINPEASTTSLQTASGSSEYSQIPPSVVQSVSNEGADILDFNHTLKAHELAQVKEDTLSDFGLGSSQHSIDSSWDALEKEARCQKNSIDALHRRLELLSSSVDKTTCVFPTKYQDMNNAEIIEIYCEKPEGTETKKFLLDNGRLQLEPIKLTFGLATVELWLDGIPCVAGANIDGYIPLRFSPSTRLHITGRPANK